MIASDGDKSSNVDLRKAIDIFADKKSRGYPLSQAAMSLQGRCAVDQRRLWSRYMIKGLGVSNFPGRYGFPIMNLRGKQNPKISVLPNIIIILMEIIYPSI